MPTREQINRYSATKSLSETASIEFSLGLVKPSWFATHMESITNADPARAPAPSGQVSTLTSQSVNLSISLTSACACFASSCPKVTG